MKISTLTYSSPLFSTLCRWKASPWSPSSCLFIKQEAVSCRSNFSRSERKQTCVSVTLGFLSRIMALTVSATTSLCESSRRYPTTDLWGCSYASNATQSYRERERVRESKWESSCKSHKNRYPFPWVCWC